MIFLVLGILLIIIFSVLFSVLRISSECSRREEEKFNVFEEIKKDMD